MLGQQYHGLNSSFDASSMTSADYCHVVQITAAIYATICTCEPGKAFMGDSAGLHAAPALLKTVTQ
jgi:hypothetical protein